MAVLAAANRGVGGPFCFCMAESMRQQVLLFNPKSDFYAMPLGLLAVGSALSTDRYEVSILDARIESRAEQTILEKARTAVAVGMTVFSGPSIGMALRLSRELKKLFPALPVVWGGWHPSILPEQCIESGAVDAVVIAQGETTFRELLDVIHERDRWSDIPGLCINSNGAAKRTSPRPLARMDQFPAARYELLDVENYFRHKGKRQIDYSSSRGCPYKCTFCADPIVYESKWTGFAAPRIVDELQYLHRQYRMDEVFFLDDDLFASLKRIQALAAEFVRAKIQFTWKGTARADELCRLPEEFFDVLRASGCARINVGAESGSQRMLDRIKKQYRVDQILTAARRAARAGIALSYSFIAGFPGETESDFQATIDVFRTLRRESSTFEANVYFYSPYPGTELVQELEKKGVRLPERLEDWDDFNIDSAWNSPDRPRLERRVRNINFYMRHGYSLPSTSAPRRVLQTVSRFRCDRDWYGFPVERYVAEALHR
jgi:anaerobic magnesium-protoporphyrin IX monomethyl ester cyclase